MPDTIDHPNHYRADSGCEVIDVITSWELNFALGNAVKYIARAGLKHDAVNDLQKAIWYLQYEVDQRTGE